MAGTFQGASTLLVKGKFDNMQYIFVFSSVNSVAMRQLKELVKHAAFFNDYPITEVLLVSSVTNETFWSMSC